MKKILMLFLLVTSASVFAAEIEKSTATYDLYHLVLERGETINLVATTGAYKDYWKRSNVVVSEVRTDDDGELTRTYLFGQTFFAHKQIVPHEDQLKIREDRAIVKIKSETDVFLDVVRIIAPSTLTVSIEKKKKKNSRNRN